MRRLIRFLSVVAMVVGFPAAVVAFFVATHLDMVTSKARPEPQPLRLAELIKQGAGDNLHVELSGFTFGKPVVEEKGGRREAVWLPMFPAGRRSATPPVFLRTELAPDQAAIDSLLKQESLRVLVSSSMPASRWNFPPAAILYGDFPKLDPDKTIVLVEPLFVMNGKAYLTSEQLFDPSLARKAWIATAATVGCGLAGVAGWFLASSRKRSGKRGSKRDLLDAARLPEERPISNHAYMPEGALKKGVGFIGATLVTALFGLVLLGVAANGFKKSDMKVAAGAGLFGGLLLVASAALVVFTINELFHPIKQVALYRGGIRWVRGDTVYTALWSDIEAVYRQITEMYYNGQYKGTIKLLILKLGTGEYLRFDADVLSDYDSFADGVQGAHGGYMLQFKLREQAETGEAVFEDIAVRPDGVSVRGTFIPWGRLDRFEVASGNLNLYSSQFAWSKCRSFALKDIPNYAALLEMLRGRVMSY